MINEIIEIMNVFYLLFYQFQNEHIQLYFKHFENIQKQYESNLLKMKEKYENEISLLNEKLNEKNRNDNSHPITSSRYFNFNNISVFIIISIKQRPYTPTRDIVRSQVSTYYHY